MISLGKEIIGSRGGGNYPVEHFSKGDDWL
jgi:hypothetical protein